MNQTDKKHVLCWTGIKWHSWNLTCCLLRLCTGQRMEAEYVCGLCGACNKQTKFQNGGTKLIFASWHGTKQKTSSLGNTGRVCSSSVGFGLKAWRVLELAWSKGKSWQRILERNRCVWLTQARLKNTTGQRQSLQHRAPPRPCCGSPWEGLSTVPSGDRRVTHFRSSPLPYTDHLYKSSWWIISTSSCAVSSNNYLILWSS